MEHKNIITTVIFIVSRFSFYCYFVNTRAILTHGKDARVSTENRALPGTTGVRLPRVKITLVWLETYNNIYFVFGMAKLHSNLCGTVYINNKYIITEISGVVYVYRQWCHKHSLHRGKN